RRHRCPRPGSGTRADLKGSPPMRTRRLLIVVLVAVGLMAAACSDSDNDPSVSSDDGSSTTQASSDAAAISFVPLEPGAVPFEALEKGDVDMALLFISQGIIAAKGWVYLYDDMSLQVPEQLITI